MQQKDHYATLGVPRNADDEMIKRAYRQLAREDHPDVNADKQEAELRFKEINEAHRVLSNRLLRQMYDRSLAELENSAEGASAQPTKDAPGSSDPVRQETEPAHPRREVREPRQFSNDGVGYPVTINMVVEDSKGLENAAQAIREEYRATTRWKRLQCRRVTLLDDDADAGIYVLHVGRGIEFDWTWEGALAVRPHDMTDNPDQEDLDKLAVAVLNEATGGVNWQGEVVEVNEAAGEIYVFAGRFGASPLRGFVRCAPIRVLGSSQHYLHQ